MFKIQLLGNIGADARVETVNGSQFMAFNVAHTVKRLVNHQEVSETIWISCTINRVREKLLPFLKKGVKVFIQGDGAVREYWSTRENCKRFGLNCFVDTLELAGEKGEKMPKQVFDSNGVVFDVATSHFIQGEQLPSEVHDADMNAYQVDDFGTLKPIRHENAQS